MDFNALKGIAKPSAREKNNETLAVLLRVSTKPDEGADASDFDHLCDLVGVPRNSRAVTVMDALLEEAGLGELIPAEERGERNSDAIVVGRRMPVSAAKVIADKLGLGEVPTSGAQAFREILSAVLAKKGVA